jgi:peptidoglycan/LPS O-acetylase OafA/YrhL
MPLVIGCAVLIMINKNSLFNRSILGSKPMNFIAKITYSWYIWHQGVIMLFPMNKYISIGVAVIAILVYQVEERIRFSKHPLTIPFILGFGSILLIIAFVIRFS